MQHEKFNLYVSEYTSKNKEEAISQSPIFKSQLRDKLLRTKFITVSGLLRFILRGHTINLGTVRNKNLMALDIDNNGKNKIMSHDQLLEILAGINVYPVFILKTMSSTPDNPRFRIILALDKDIVNTDDYIDNVKALVKCINQLYPDSADPKCCDTLSLFYPCTECLYSSPEARTSLDSLDKLTTIMLPDKTVSLNLVRFFAPILYNAKLMTLQEYEQYSNCTTPITFFWHQKRCLYNIPECYITHLKKSMNKKSTGNLYRETKNICLDNYVWLEDPIKPIFPRHQKSNIFLDKQFNLGSFSLLFNFDVKNELTNVLFDKTNQHPTAKILTNNSGLEQYCLIDKTSKKIKEGLSPIDFFMHFFFQNDFKDVMKILYKLCNIEITTNAIQSHKSNLNHYLNALTKQIPKYKYLNEILIYKDNNATIYILSILIQNSYNAYVSLKDKVPYGCDYNVQILANAKYIYTILKEQYLNISIAEDTIKVKIILLEKLGLIEYVKEDSMNNFALGMIAKFKSKNKYINKQSSAITIPKYNTELLREANQRAKDFLSNGNNTLAAAYVRNKKTIYNSPYFIEGNKFIQKYFANGAIYMPQPELSHFYMDDMKVNSPNVVVSKYKPYLIKENNLKVVLLTKQIMKKFKITKETVKQKRYKLGHTNIFIKEE